MKENLRRLSRPQWRDSKVKGRAQFGATVYERLKELPISKHQNLTVEIKSEIGKLVNEAFMQNPKEKRGGLFQKSVSEPEGDFKVFAYPARFVPVIDSIIYKYFQNGQSD